MKIKPRQLQLSGFLFKQSKSLITKQCKCMDILSELMPLVEAVFVLMVPLMSTWQKKVLGWVAFIWLICFAIASMADYLASTYHSIFGA